jgi:hypothetical protein
MPGSAEAGQSHSVAASLAAKPEPERNSIALQTMQIGWSNALLR